MGKIKLMTFKLKNFILKKPSRNKSKTSSKQNYYSFRLYFGFIAELSNFKINSITLLLKGAWKGEKSI